MLVKKMENSVEDQRINKKKVNELGYCWCGCGNKTNISTETSRAKQKYKGIPMRYINGHGRRLKNPYTIAEIGKPFLHHSKDIGQFLALKTLYLEK